MNSVTGDRLTTGHVTDAFRDNYDAIFKKRTIYYWPNYVWCDREDLEDTMRCMSDDFGKLEVSWDADDESIDRMVKGAADGHDL